MKQFMDNVTTAESEKFDLLLAEFFFGCNVPFQAVESKYFRNFIQALRPAYAIPSRKKLSNNLLEKVHAKCERQNGEFIAVMKKRATLLVDGWTNSNANRHCFVALLATADDQKVFLESYDISEIGERSEILKKIVGEAVVLAKDRYDCDVYAVVSDNAPNMTCMGAQIQSELMYTTCDSHTGNLLAKDVVTEKKYQTIMNKVMKVQKNFRLPGLESQLTKIGGKKPVLYSLIRFASTRGAVESFLHNLPFMKKVSANDDVEETDNAIESPEIKTPDPVVTQLLFNVQFIDSVKHLYLMLNPIAKLINICQQGNASNADSIEEWLDLLSTGPAELKVLAEKRITKSNVFNDITLSANFFHPTYRGNKLNESQRQKVNDFVFEMLDSKGLESFRSFSSDEGTFSALKRKGITSTETYWYYAAKRGHTELADLATKLLKIPASTCQLERLFSNWSFIHNELRNRLTPDHSKKLLNIYFTLRSNDLIQQDEEDFFDDFENFNITENPVISPCRVLLERCDK